MRGRPLTFSMSTNDPKQGEREYYLRIGEEGRRHATRKPFDDANTVRHIARFGAMLTSMRPPPARVVEFGCGTGWLSLMFAQSGYEVIGVDISPEAIALAEQAREERGIAHAAFRVGDYESIHIPEPADYVVFYDALHHAEVEEDALRTAHRILVPGGAAFCWEPGEGHAATPLAKELVRDYGVHEKDMPPTHIFSIARRVGFRRHQVLPLPEEYLGLLYRPGYTRAASQRDMRGRELLSLTRIVRWFFCPRPAGFVILYK